MHHICICTVGERHDVGWLSSKDLIESPQRLEQMLLIRCYFHFLSEGLLKFTWLGIHNSKKHIHVLTFLHLTTVMYTWPYPHGFPWVSVVKETLRISVVIPMPPVTALSQTD